uniref:Uncharacterized protein n=1 Tax=Arundo donax TaxID=35708 RepID=A0A0A9CXL4_ARUDO
MYNLGFQNIVLLLNPLQIHYHLYCQHHNYGCHFSFLQLSIHHFSWHFYLMAA